MRRFKYLNFITFFIFTFILTSCDDLVLTVEILTTENEIKLYEGEELDNSFFKFTINENQEVKYNISNNYNPNPNFEDRDYVLQEVIFTYNDYVSNPIIIKTIKNKVKNIEIIINDPKNVKTTYYIDEKLKLDSYSLFVEYENNKTAKIPLSKEYILDYDKIFEEKGFKKIYAKYENITSKNSINIEVIKYDNEINTPIEINIFNLNQLIIKPNDNYEYQIVKGINLEIEPNKDNWQDSNIFNLNYDNNNYEYTIYQREKETNLNNPSNYIKTEISASNLDKIPLQTKEINKTKIELKYLDNITYYLNDNLINPLDNKIIIDNLTPNTNYQIKLKYNLKNSLDYIYYLKTLEEKEPFIYNKIQEIEYNSNPYNFIYNKKEEYKNNNLNEKIFYNNKEEIPIDQGEYIVSIKHDYYNEIVEIGKVIITKKDITIKINDVTKEYLKDTPEITTNIYSIIYERDINTAFIYDFNIPSTNEIGQYEITGKITHNNYNITVEKGILTIIKRNIKAKINDITLLYKEDFKDNGITFLEEPIFDDKSVNIEFEITITSNIKNSDAGIYNNALKATVLNNYYNVEIIDNGILTINKREIDITIPNIEIIYGEEINYNYQVSDDSFREDLNDLEFRIASNDVGTQDIYPVKKDFNNFIINYKLGKVIINQKDVTIVLNKNYKYYGEKDDLSYTYSSLVYNDKLEEELTRENNENVGEYQIGLTNLINNYPNYNFILENDKYIINKLKVDYIYKNNFVYGDELDFNFKLNKDLPFNEIIKFNPLNLNTGEYEIGFEIYNNELITTPNYEINNIIKYKITKKELIPIIQKIYLLDNQEIPTIIPKFEGIIEEDLNKEDLYTYELEISNEDILITKFESLNYYLNDNKIGLIIKTSINYEIENLEFIYDKNIKKINILNIDSQKEINKDEVIIKYYQNDLEIEPINAGRYKVEIKYQEDIQTFDLVINKRQAEIEVLTLNKIYKEEEPQILYNILNKIEDDLFIGTVIREEGEEVKEYNLNTTLNNPNYELKFKENYKFKILKRDLELEIKELEIEYGDNYQLDFIKNTLLEEDKDKISLYIEDKIPNKYEILIKDENNILNNYNYQLDKKYLTITKKNINFLEQYETTYNGKIQSLNLDINLAYDDKLVLTNNTNINKGIYNLNYDILNNNKSIKDYYIFNKEFITYIINPKKISISFYYNNELLNNKEIIFDNINHYNDISYKVEGLINNEEIIKSVTEFKNVGTYEYIIDINSDNYTYDNNKFILKINKKDLILNKNHYLRFKSNTKLELDIENNLNNLTYDLKEINKIDKEKRIDYQYEINNIYLDNIDNINNFNIIYSELENSIYLTELEEDYIMFMPFSKDIESDLSDISLAYGYKQGYYVNKIDSNFDSYIFNNNLYYIFGLNNELLIYTKGIKENINIYGKGLNLINNGLKISSYSNTLEYQFKFNNTYEGLIELKYEDEYNNLTFGKMNVKIIDNTYNIDSFETLNNLNRNNINIALINSFEVNYITSFNNCIIYGNDYEYDARRLNNTNYMFDSLLTLNNSQMYNLRLLGRFVDDAYWSGTKPPTKTSFMGMTTLTLSGNKSIINNSYIAHGRYSVAITAKEAEVNNTTIYGGIAGILYRSYEIDNNKERVLNLNNVSFIQQVRKDPIENNIKNEDKTYVTGAPIIFFPPSATSTPNYETMKLNLNDVKMHTFAPKNDLDYFPKFIRQFGIDFKKLWEGEGIDAELYELVKKTIFTYKYKEYIHMGIIFVSVSNPISSITDNIIKYNNKTSFTNFVNYSYNAQIIGLNAYGKVYAYNNGVFENDDYILENNLIEFPQYNNYNLGY